jgi:hypothetical protein
LLGHNSDSRDENEIILKNFKTQQMITKTKESGIRWQQSFRN